MPALTDANTAQIACEEAETIVGLAMTFWEAWEAEEHYVSAETVLAQWQAKTALLAACAARAQRKDGIGG